jgi:D-alanyl-D-alanine-carboxypeptidase/D-alanyl-D-alanine-endopeptidase
MTARTLATLSLGLLCAVVAASCSVRASGIASPGDIRSSLATYVQAYPHAVVVVGVIDANNTKIYTASSPSVKGTTDEYSEFQIGSITKTFTATLLAQMILSGAVTLDDPISKFLPKGVTAPSFDGKSITLRALAEQNSGLPRLPSNMHPADPADPYADYTTAKLYDFLSNYRLTQAPGAQYEYSNLGVTLLGQLLANREHTSYANLLSERVLRPLGMMQTTVATSSAFRERLVPGYAADGSPQPAWTFGELGAAGAIESNLHDMLIYLRANMLAPNGTLGRAMALAQKPVAPIDSTGLRQIGLVWMTNSRSGITWHNGETGGYHSFIGFNPGNRRGVVVLANVADMDVDRLAVHVLAPYVPAPHPLGGGSKEPSPYSGRYAFSPAFAITVFQVNEQLYAQGTGQQPLALTRMSSNTFAVQGVDARITFDVDANGVATALTLHQNGLDQHALKSP